MNLPGSSLFAAEIASGSRPSDSRGGNFYAGVGLDRVGHLRKDPAWLRQRLADPGSRFVPVWHAQSLIRETADGPEAVFVSPVHATSLIAAGAEVVLLGLDSAVAFGAEAGPATVPTPEAERAQGAPAFFALDISLAEDPLAALGFRPSVTIEGRDAGSIADVRGLVRFQDLRVTGPLLSRHEGAVLGYARGMLHWHARHRFCGICGSPTLTGESGHVRLCISPDCKAHHFPRTDPAVIMLVTDGENALLGRQKSWATGMYSTLAGFVEPGESLEEAVRREVMEEAGVAVGEVAYHSSQPWPFPGSIMLGFEARASSREILLQDAELEDARWFSRGWLLDRPDDDLFRLPRKDSIARRLIEDWLRRG